SLALGAPRPAAKGAQWSTQAFGAPFAAAPVADLALSADELDLASGVAGHDAKLHLSLAPNLLTLANLSMTAGGGRIGGQITLRRDGPVALASGNLQVDSLAFHVPYASGQASGTFDFTAAGQNAAAFVASLAGNGSVRLSGLTVERTDPGALARIITATDQGSVAVDEPEVRSALGLELDKASLHLDDASYDANMAAGTLRLAAKNNASEASTAGLRAVFDLRQASLDARVTITSKTVPRDWNGPPPQAAIVWHGPLDAANRSLDSAGFFNALAGRALVREAARADMLEQDIRERAYFNRYLKGLQFMHRRAREIAVFKAQQAEAARRAAELARQAEAARADTQPAVVPTPPRDSRPAPNVVPPPSLPLPLNLHPSAPQP
ncbi:MAG TPA: hypothetical protein VG271_02605, partial [Beijerinckiaceae bacterium]|nr:hypothetical protein [Beijerinckiaceae bacterium]